MCLAFFKKGAHPPWIAAPALRPQRQASSEFPCDVHCTRAATNNQNGLVAEVLLRLGKWWLKLGETPFTRPFKHMHTTYLWIWLQPLVCQNEVFFSSLGNFSKPLRPLRNPPIMATSGSKGNIFVLETLSFFHTTSGNLRLNPFCWHAFIISYHWMCHTFLETTCNRPGERRHPEKTKHLPTINFRWNRCSWLRYIQQPNQNIP